MLNAEHGISCKCGENFQNLEDLAKHLQAQGSSELPQPGEQPVNSKQNPEPQPIGPELLATLRDDGDIELKAELTDQRIYLRPEEIQRLAAITQEETMNRDP
jgi:hypothetical protein